MRLRIATLNVWGLPWPAARDGRRRLAAIGDGLPGLGADVFAFQEVWTPAARESLLAAGHRAGLTESWHPAPTLVGSGLLVLSRLPIARAEFARFAMRGLPRRPWHGDFYSGKGFCRLDLAGEGGVVHLLATHFHASYGPRRRSADEACRTAQARQLAARVRELAGPLVVAGDLNGLDREPAYQVLTGLAGLRDVAVSLDRGLPTLLATNPYHRARGRPDERVDYVLVRDGAAATVRPVALRRIFDEVLSHAGRPWAASDHAGLLAELEIEPALRPGGG